VSPSLRDFLLKRSHFLAQRLHFLFIDCQLFDCAQPALLRSADLLRQDDYLLLQVAYLLFQNR
jgi:hypothetical protein